MEYQDFIQKINTGSITAFTFSVDGYNHYRDCKISRVKDPIFNGKVIELIQVILTPDESEKVSFLRTFNESYKLFRMGSSGTFTLKQLWKKILIKEIVYSNIEPVKRTCENL